MTRGPKAPASKQKHGKRKDGGITHRLSTGKGHGKGCEKWIDARLLVYCTFCVGHWDDSLTIESVNGRASDIRPDNLVEHLETIPQEWTERISKYSFIYEKDFNEVVRHVQWDCGISKEDAKDVVSTTYIWLCTSGFRSEMNTAIWIYWSRLRGEDFKRHFLNYVEGEIFDIQIEQYGITDKSYEVDLYHFQKGEKRSRFLELWAQGHTPTEIAEVCDTTISNVGSSVTRSIQFLKNLLKDEEKYIVG